MKLTSSTPGLSLVTNARGVRLVGPCRKDLLLRVLRKMKAVHGDVYGFHPDGYLLPTEYTKFIDAFTRLQPVSAGTDLPRVAGATRTTPGHTVSPRGS